MRALVHLCAAALLVPQVAILTLFLALGHVTGGHTLGSLFTRTLDLLGLLFGWGGLAAIVITLLILGAGFHPRSRPFASATLILLVIASTVGLALMGIPAGVDDVLLFLSALAAATLSVCLLRLDLRRPAGVRPLVVAVDKKRRPKV